MLLVAELASIGLVPVAAVTGWDLVRTIPNDLKAQPARGNLVERGELLLWRASLLPFFLRRQRVRDLLEDLREEHVLSSGADLDEKLGCLQLEVGSERDAERSQRFGEVGQEVDGSRTSWFAELVQDRRCLQRCAQRIAIGGDPSGAQPDAVPVGL